MSAFTDDQAVAHLRRVTGGFGPLVADGLIAFAEAADAIDVLIFTDPRFAAFDDTAQWRLSELAHSELTIFIDRPALASERAIRDALGPLMTVRKPRSELVIAAYRAANGRIDARTVEHIVAEEITAYMARIHQSRGFRRAG